MINISIETYIKYCFETTELRKRNDKFALKHIQNEVYSR